MNTQDTAENFETLKSMMYRRIKASEIKAIQREKVALFSEYKAQIYGKMVKLCLFATLIVGCVFAIVSHKQHQKLEIAENKPPITKIVNTKSEVLIPVEKIVEKKVEKIVYKDRIVYKKAKHKPLKRKSTKESKEIRYIPFIIKEFTKCPSGFKFTKPNYCYNPITKTQMFL
jgi:hypothetical protein